MAALNCRDTDGGVKPDTEEGSDGKQNQDQNGDPQFVQQIFRVRFVLFSVCRIRFFPGRGRQAVFFFKHPRLSGKGAQLVGKHLHGGIALFRGLRQGGVQHPVHFGRDTGDGFRSGRDRTAGMLHHDGEGGVSLKEFLPGDHLIIDDSQ